MTDRLTTQQLTDIERALPRLSEYAEQSDDVRAVAEGVPVLLAEIRRLQTELDQSAEDVDRAAAGARQNRQPATAYSDGKGRVYCIGCREAVGADVPLTATDVEPHELCPSCGRHVVDVAAAGARQDGAQQ